MLVNVAPNLPGDPTPNPLLLCYDAIFRILACVLCLLFPALRGHVVHQSVDRTAELGERRLQEIGGIAPLVFGQYGELSASFETLIDTLAVKGCDQAADHYLLDVGPAAASVQKRLLRQRVSCCVARAQAGVLLRRLKFALPGWAAAESRRGRWERESAQRAAQARAFSGEGHSEEWAFFFGAPH